VCLTGAWLNGAASHAAPRRRAEESQSGTLPLAPLLDLVVMVWRHTVKAVESAVPPPGESPCSGGVTAVQHRPLDELFPRLCAKNRVEGDQANLRSSERVSGRADCRKGEVSEGGQTAGTGGAGRVVSRHGLTPPRIPASRPIG